MLVLLLVGVPFVIVLLGPLLLGTVVFHADISMTMFVQQFVSGFRPVAFACIPMFILAATIVSQGQAGQRLVNFVRAYLGHVTGGLPLCTTAACTLFGAVSGSTQATVAAIGGTMRPILLKGGYKSSFTLALIINSSDIAILIPPSVGAIIYGIVTKISVGQLFLACVGPGLLVFTAFSLYCLVYARVKRIPTAPKAPPEERAIALKQALPLTGFPLVIIGGIYTGIFTPTEAAAVSVAYALVMESVVYRQLSFRKFFDAALSTGMMTTAVYVLIGAGKALAWLLCYFEVPQSIVPYVFGSDPSALHLLVAVNLAYFVLCMFISPTVAIYILTPFYLPLLPGSGIDPIFMGVLVVMQGAIGSATPPFGCDIFTAMMIFKRPYWETIRETHVFVLLLLLCVVLIVVFPDIAMFLPRYAFGH